MSTHRDIFLAKYGPSEHIDRLMYKFPGYISGRDDLEDHHIDKMVNSSDAWVRAAIAHHDRLLPSHYETLANDPHEDTRAALAKNRSTPDDIIYKLREDPVYRVRKWADLTHEARMRERWKNERRT